MKKYILAALAAALWCIPAFAQEGTPVKALYGSGAPQSSLIGPGVVGTQYIDQSTSPPTVYTCTIVTIANPNKTCTWTAGGSSSSSSPSSAYTFYPVSGTSCTAQNYSAAGTFYCAFPGLPNGNPTYSGTDFAVVFNNVTTLLASVGGSLKWRSGVYNINSMTVETQTGCPAFTSDSKPLAYGMAFPANAQAASVQWLLEGESTSVWLGESLPLTINTAGVIFNITPTAVSSVTAGALLNGFWSRPFNTCTLTAGFGGTPNVNNDVHYKNMTVRFPVNTRGNEIAFNAWFAADVEYENTVADFNVTYKSLAQGSAPTAGTYGSFGMTTSVSAAGDWEFFKNTFVTGYQYGYDFLSEHIITEVGTAIYCSFPGVFGRAQGTAINHPSVLLHFNDQENGAGFQFGPSMGQGSRVDMIDLAFEIPADGNWYSTTRGTATALSETNVGYTVGSISYTYIGGASIIPIALPSPNLFTSGGTRFQSTPNGQSPNFALANVADNFTRANGGIGPDWASCSSVISSNTAVGNGAAVPCIYSQQASNNDQFSRATIVTVDASGMDVIVRSTIITPTTYYDYTCATSGGRLLRKRIAGTFTTLASTATNCSIGQVMELQVIGPAIIALLNGLPDLVAIDSSIASGVPGFSMGGAGDSISNWSGGSLPVLDFAAGQQRSLFAPASYRSIPAKTFVTTADYTNATTTFSNLTGVGQISSGLSFPVAANVSYTLHCAITWSASAVTAGPQFQITGPASPTNVSINMVSAITATTTASAAAVAFSSALNPVGAAVTSAANETAYIDMGLANGANAGTIQLQAAAQGAGTLTIRQGSSCTLQ